MSSASLIRSIAKYATQPPCALQEQSYRRLTAVAITSCTSRLTLNLKLVPLACQADTETLLEDHNVERDQACVEMRNRPYLDCSQGPIRVAHYQQGPTRL